MPARWDTVQVDGAPMRCYVTVPEGPGPFPAVIVIQHAGGVDAFVQTMTDRIAEAGFVGVAPDLYHREDPSSADDPMTRMGRLRDRTIIADVNAAIEHAKTLPEFRADRIGITGFCMGGRVAYLMATKRPDLKAAVVFYGGNIFVPWGEGPSPFDGTADIACPILGLFGEDDPNPSPRDVARLDAELTRLGKPHEFHSYAGAGHAFMNEGRPSYRPEAARDAWQKCVAWFERYLKT
ncbi:MAG TPA: dienelactone hydrolase family protein [Dehalococcoidia bacterium]|nr:dienelactone hydrolase family protein [Dehalococcoidia bacterium]